MHRLAMGLARGVRRGLARADASMNRLYGWQRNPLYLSGTLAVVSLGVVLVTGVYLLLFYRIGAPYASVERITDQVWAGRWIRSLHRYASDAAVVAAAAHALRLFVQDRSWGPRALAWVSGLILLFIVLVCGWTGYVMVWDVQGEVLAREGARFFDFLPLFSEPISRAFAGDRAIPSAFFFLNLFLHVALPIGVGLLLWIHVSRVARPAILPPRGLLWGVTGLLLALSVIWPVAMAPAADPFRIPDRAPYDLFYSFWLPLVRPLPVGAAWALVLVVSAVALGTPLWARPRPKGRRPPSEVDERLCTGCEQCYLDCSYEAIAMVTRADGLDTLVAHVEPGRCTSCGICAGSCAPMGVGPAGRTGRDQLARVAAFVAERAPGPRDVVVVACGRGAGGLAAQGVADGAPVYAVECAGNLHSSVVEYLVRSGAGGVLVVSCPPRDCWNREGPKWLEARLYHDREAELQPRVDRRRVRLLYAAEGERDAVLAELREFRVVVEILDAAPREREIDLVALCEPSGEAAAS
ncbi:MAG: cytochrome b N-terminal domain-containing protein [Gemmatimonadota bacterium]